VGPLSRSLTPQWKSPNSINLQLSQIGKLLNTEVVSKGKCIDYYDKTLDTHPTVGRLKGYSRMVAGYKNWYDATATSTILKDIQKTILNSCGLEPNEYKHVSNNDEDPYEILSDRLPGRSVILVKRDSMRKLLNIQELYKMCQKLNLDCRIFDANKIFKQAPENNDYLCAARKEFSRDDPILLGV